MVNRLPIIGTIITKFRYFIYKKTTSNNGSIDKIISNLGNTWYVVFLNLIQSTKQTNLIFSDKNKLS